MYAYEWPFRETLLMYAAALCTLNEAKLFGMFKKKKDSNVNNGQNRSGKGILE